MRHIWIPGMITSELLVHRLDHQTTGGHVQGAHIFIYLFTYYLAEEN